MRPNLYDNDLLKGLMSLLSLFLNRVRSSSSEPLDQRTIDEFAQALKINHNETIELFNNLRATYNSLPLADQKLFIKVIENEIKQLSEDPVYAEIDSSPPSVFLTKQGELIESDEVRSILYLKIENEKNPEAHQKNSNKSLPTPPNQNLLANSPSTAMGTLITSAREAVKTNGDGYAVANTPGNNSIYEAPASMATESKHEEPEYAVPNRLDRAERNKGAQAETEYVYQDAVNALGFRKDTEQKSVGKVSQDNSSPHPS